uniref:Protein kinase domain-containing protein n=1 Tax=Panagrolaimus sp. ES5 TaxID=591445 RepID=A0AC34FCW8_9BILA
MIVKKENYNTSLKFIADYYNETTDCDIAIPTKDKRDAIYFITLVVKDYNRNTREITTAFSDYDLRNENLSTEKYLERKFSGIFDNARTITSFDIVNSLSTHYNDPQQVAIFTDDFNYLKGFDSGSLNRENRKINYILYLTSENQTLVENLEKTFYRDKIDKFIHSTFYIMTPNKRENASSENVCNQIKEPPPPLLIWWYWALIFIGCFVVAIGIGILYQIFKKNPVSALLETYQIENKDELKNECDKRRLFKNDFQINFNVVKGHGVSSTVYEAKIKRDLIPNLLKKSMENNTPSEYCIVAAKILNNYEDDEIFEVIGEIQAVQKLGNHDKICTLLGWSTHSSAPCLFFEMMEMDLQSYLISLRKPATNASIKRNEMILCATTFGEKFVVPEFDTKQNIIFLQILWQISQGLEYIASKNIVHRDVAARNILLSHYGNNETFIAKITDFGLCILLDKNTNVYHSTSNKLLPNKWLAIECHLDRMFSQASDVWAFGILMIEIYTCAGNLYPHVGLNELVHYLKNGKRMEKPKNMPQELYDLAFSCWDKNPYSRKSFSKMCLELKMMLREVNSCNSEYVDEWQV